MAGKYAVVAHAFIALYAILFIVVVGAALLKTIDYKYVTWHEATAEVTKKWIEHPCDEGCWEVGEKEPGARFVTELWCEEAKTCFRRVINEDLFDILKEGDKFPIAYEVGRISDNARLRKAPVTAWQWEMDELV